MMNVRAQGEGFFAAFETEPYLPAGSVIGQTYRDSCVAACCRMLLRDEGLIWPEAVIRAALVADTRGALISAAPQALQQLGSVGHYVYQQGLSFVGFQQGVMKGTALAFLKDDPMDDFGHAVLVDGLADDWVLIRDPWPLASGSAYRVELAVFLSVWLQAEGEDGPTRRAVVKG